MHPAEPTVSVKFVWGPTERRRERAAFGLVMGYEASRPRKIAGHRGYAGPGISEAHGAFLHQYPEFSGSWLEDDVDAEHSTWAEMIDQTRLGLSCGADDVDDREEDDAAGGNITDYYHDAVDEDGI